MAAVGIGVAEEVGEGDGREGIRVGVGCVVDFHHGSLRFGVGGKEVLPESSLVRRHHQVTAVMQFVDESFAE